MYYKEMYFSSNPFCWPQKANIAFLAAFVSMPFFLVFVPFGFLAGVIHQYILAAWFAARHIYFLLMPRFCPSNPIGHKANGQKRRGNFAWSWWKWRCWGIGKPNPCTIANPPHLWPKIKILKKKTSRLRDGKPSEMNWIELEWWAIKINLCECATRRHQTADVLQG